MVDRWGILLLIFLWFSAASRDVALDAGTSGSRWTTWPIGTEAELAAGVRSSVDKFSKGALRAKLSGAPPEYNCW